jgi:hypothetical protein
MNLMSPIGVLGIISQILQILIEVKARSFLHFLPKPVAIGSVHITEENEIAIFPEEPRKVFEEVHESDLVRRVGMIMF